MIRVAAILCLCLLIATCCFAEGLDTLIEVGKSQGEIQQQYSAETRTFDNVKKAIMSGAIKKGLTKSDIESRYGEPVVAIKDADGIHEDWIYKPAESSFFKGVRATLFFTQDGMLSDMKIEEK